MPQEHYFSSEPVGEFQPKLIEVTIAEKKVTVETAGGIFSPDHIDTGTAVLLEHLDLTPAVGDVLDIGCGWGPIALSIAAYRPHTMVWAVDVNERALELTRRNSARLGLTNVKVCTPDQVPTNIEFAGIWSNPPIRVGKDVLHDILKTWIPRLAIGASSFLVVQKNLGADSLLPKNFFSERFDSGKQFRVLKVIRKG